MTARVVADSEPLVLEHLTVTYGRRVALQDVSATIRRGTFVGVIGPNGAGKSTLLKAMLGIVPAHSGSVRIFGKTIDEGREHVAYVPQREAVHWDFPVSVLDVVTMGRYRRRGWFRLPEKSDREAARRALDEVGMLQRWDEQIGQLSGGQQQRVFLARALAQDAEILLLDEPLNGVDARTQEMVLEIIGRLTAAGRTVVMATHDLKTAADACDCLACVNHNLIAYGPAGDTFTEDILERTYGGSVLVVNRENLGAERRPVHHRHPLDHPHEHDLGHAAQHEHAADPVPTAPAPGRQPDGRSDS
jgi:manganese/zinc/iron transport system ATP- binding protein